MKDHMTKRRIEVLREFATENLSGFPAASRRASHTQIAALLLEAAEALQYYHHGYWQYRRRCQRMTHEVAL